MALIKIGSEDVDGANLVNDVITRESSSGVVDDTNHSVSGNVSNSLQLPEIVDSVAELVTNLEEHSLVAIESDASYFVRTDDLDDATDILEEKGLVVLCGPPGSGKTFLAQALLRRCQDAGFKPFVISDVKDWQTHVTARGRSVVLMDGTLGRVRVDKQQYTQWSSALPNLLKLTGQGQCRLVLTLYPHVLRELRELEGETKSPLLDDLAVTHLMKNPLSCDVKEQLLHSHLQELRLEPSDEASLVQEILSRDVSGPVFHWCCRYLVDNWLLLKDEDPARAFTVPAEAYVPLLKGMLRDSQHGDTFAAVLALTMKGLGGFLHDPCRVEDHLKELRLKEYSEYQLTEYADALKGSILGPADYGFASRVLYDATGLALGRAFPLPILLKVCDVQFLVTYLRTHAKESFSVQIGAVVNVRELFMQKVYDCVVNGFTDKLCQHPCLSDPAFLEEFEAFCLKKKNSLDRFITAVDSIHGVPLLYWSVWSPTPHLTEWCIQIINRPYFFRKIPSEGVLSSALMCTIFTDSQEEPMKQKTKIFAEELLRMTKVDLLITDPTLLTVDFPCPRQNLTKDCRSKYSYLQQRIESRVVPASELTVHSAELTDDKVTVDVTKKDWWLMIMLAARGVEDADDRGDTNLHTAVALGNKEAIRTLIRRGASLKKKNKWGLTPPKVAERRWKSSQENSEYKRLDLHAAIKAGDIESVKVLLCGGGTVHDRQANSTTPLHSAAQAGQLDIATLLLELGADVNARLFFTSDTPLHDPCTRGNLDMVLLLVQHGADVNVAGFGGYTPLHLACMSGNVELVELLIGKKADVNLRTRDDDRTPLHEACAHGHTDVIRLLLCHGADVRTKNKEGLTPLKVARRKGLHEVVELMNESS
ncbi:uncharacterized protein [Littorina saxatilis]|uniref:uncharacterized protein n=1 Tax=Littorina saxatilis TaxID=31220 RepID=UPI0038B4429E